MDNRENGLLWACPYFKGRRGLSIHCEGGCRMTLADQAAFEAFVRRHCAHVPGWEGCTIAQARNAYYER